MKTALLTTDTLHHRYYAWKLNDRFPLHQVVLEQWRPKVPFETNHPFEQQRDEYEREVLLADGPSSWRDVAQVHECERVNDGPTLEALQRTQPDVVLVFGTGLIRPTVFTSARLACLNLHGGNPEEYRGLDSHLWAIYHRDFDNLVTTLHSVDDGLDTGDVVSQARLEFPRGTELYQLRAINTRACLDLSVRALESLCGTGTIATWKQSQRGRYYSHMPACLKEECVRKFRAFTSVQ